MSVIYNTLVYVKNATTFLHRKLLFTYKHTSVHTMLINLGVPKVSVIYNTLMYV